MLPAKYRYQSSIEGWQRQFEWLYSPSNAEAKSAFPFALRVAELGGILTSQKHQSEWYYGGLYARFAAWLLALSSHLRVELHKAGFEKFPGVCPYCMRAVCSEVSGRSRRTHGSYERERVAAYANEKLRAVPNVWLFSFESFGRNINTIYPANWALRVAEIGGRFHEEQSELFAAVRRFEAGACDYTLHHSARYAEIAEELADVLAWFSVLGIALREAQVPCFPKAVTSLDEVIWATYKEGCPRCHSRPCACEAPDTSRLPLPKEKEPKERGPKEVA